MVTKYGMISDVHKDPRIIAPALEAFQRAEVDKLIVNGDIGGNYGSLDRSQLYTSFILQQIADSGLEAFVQPGSHETLLGYGHVIEHFSDKYSNIIDVTKDRKVSQNGHDLVFIPGSDFSCEGEYVIGNGELPSGRFVQTGKGLVKFDDLGQYVEVINAGEAKGAFQYSNMNDLKELVTNPDKTIVVCHVPRKFDNVETGVDMAEFGEAILDFNLDGKMVKRGAVFPFPGAEKIAASGAPVLIKKENRGNEDLKNLYEELGVTKAVSAHFHESSHRAHDSYGNKVPENTLVDNLFWNSGHLDRGFTGILTVDGENVEYRSISLG